MTNIYRVSVPRERPVYFINRPAVDQGAQAVADNAAQTATIERCKIIDRSTASLAVALLNGDEWCADHHVLRYVKPRKQQYAA